MDQLLLMSGKTQFSEPTPGNGTVVPLSINQDGRLRVASKQGMFDPVTASLVAANSTLVVDVADASNLVLHVKNTGTVAMAAGQFVFEGSIDSTNGTDGTWFGVQAARSNANTIESATGALGSIAIGAGTAYGWELSVNAVKWFRVRTTTAVTTNAIAFWTAIRGSYATEPIPALQTHPVTGSVTTTPATSSAYGLITAATTNASILKASAGALFEISVFNPSAATIYVKLFNKTTAPSVGVDIPITTIPVLAGGMENVEYGALGKRFSTGISLTTTASGAATDTAAIAAGVQISATYL